MRETYQWEPSGSTAMWWGLALGEKPSSRRSTVATTSREATSTTVTAAPPSLHT